VKVVLYGFGKLGKRVYASLINNKDIELVGIVDNAVSEGGEKNVDDLTIYSIREFKRRNISVDCVVIAIIEPRSAFDAYLSSVGVAKRIFRVPVKYLEFSLSFKDNLSFFDDLIDVTQNNLPYVEMHVQDNCNLNCVACAHYSPLFKDNELTFSQFAEDIQRMRDIFSGDIFMIRLMGGEPFLNKDLERYIEVVREHFEHSDVHIVTNGLLFLGIEQKILDAIISNHIIVDISDYEPNRKLKSKIIKFAEENGVHISWVLNTREENSFSKSLSINELQNDVNPCENSMSCINIYKGKYAKCPQLMFLPKFNEYFHVDLPSDGIYDLYDKNLTAEKFICNISKSEKLCRYCDMVNPKWITWNCYTTQKRPVIEDWLI